MRLLQLDGAGGFSLVENLCSSQESPPYAILSHTWGMKNEEVTFNDLTTHTGTNKAGYQKLSFCAKQAEHDGLQFFWVDTCCIDKASSSELSEAINSMFRWYQDSAKCYVYLSDVSVDCVGTDDVSSNWQSSFNKSRWFTRGWTLQELLAPKRLEFFSKDGRYLGNKQSLGRSITRITGIPLAALQGRLLSRFSTNERMGWAAQRATTREEDAAYSLLGIFDVHMPLIYGERRTKAFTRLRDEIDKPVDILTRRYSSLESKFQEVVRMLEKRPKELGFPWETGVLEDHLKIDDGLGPGYILPVELCKTPEAFHKVLTLKFKSRRLPGLAQVQQGHILVWEWNERHLVSRENWIHVVKGDRALKVSFVMGSLQGPPRNRCMRCFKPRTCNTFQSPFKHCGSCKLAVRWVAPDYLPYEPDDIAVGDQDTYRDFQVGTRRTNGQQRNHTPDASMNKFFIDHDGEHFPSIELVSHRLTMKWEPIFNIVHRYLFCRCVVRLSTPSHLQKEMTFFTFNDCPRHNTNGTSFRDYTELAIPFQDDPYFDRFGGYNAFWAMLKIYFPDIYHNLGGPKAITSHQLECGYVGLFRSGEDDIFRVRGIAKDYLFEQLEYMESHDLPFSEEAKANFALLKSQRTKDTDDSNLWSGLDDEEKERMHKEFQDSPVGRELKEVMRGNWDGTPHWLVED